MLVRELSGYAVVDVGKDVILDELCVTVVEDAVEAEIECLWECNRVIEVGTHGGVAVSEGVAGMDAQLGALIPKQLTFLILDISFNHLPQ